MGWDPWNRTNVSGYNVFYKENYLRLHIKLALKRLLFFSRSWHCKALY